MPIDKTTQIANELTRHYNNNLEIEGLDTKIYRMSNPELLIWKKFDKMVPTNKFGMKYLKSKQGVHRALAKTKKAWEAELATYEKIVQGGADRVIEYAKENIAEKEFNKTGKTVDPEEIEDDALDASELMDDFNEEFKHNIEGKHDFLKDVPTYFDKKLKGLVERGMSLKKVIDVAYVEPIKNKGDSLIYGLGVVLNRIDKNFSKHRVMKWLFGDEEKFMDTDI